MLHSDRTEPVEPSLECRIRMRAYELYAQRRKVDGHALDDWLQAEKEILTAIAGHWADDWRAWRSDR
jgi:hypothetical protein